MWDRCSEIGQWFPCLLSQGEGCLVHCWGVGVGHGQDHRDTTSQGRWGGTWPVFFVGGSRLSNMDMHINQTCKEIILNTHEKKNLTSNYHKSKLTNVYSKFSCKEKELKVAHIKIKQWSFKVYCPVNEFHVPGSLMSLLDDIQSMCVLRGGAIPFRRLIDSISNLEHLMSVIRGTE